MSVRMFAWSHIENHGMFCSGLSHKTRLQHLDWHRSSNISSVRQTSGCEIKSAAAMPANPCMYDWGWHAYGDHRLMHASSSTTLATATTTAAILSVRQTLPNMQTRCHLACLMLEQGYMQRRAVLSSEHPCQACNTLQTSTNGHNSTRLDILSERQCRWGLGATLHQS